MKANVSSMTNAHVTRGAFYVVLLLTGTMLAYFRPEASTNVSNRTLTFAERVSYQRAIEEVYWRHRIWPKERCDPKPSLDVVVLQAQLEKKVQEYLRNSQALEDYWQQPITAEQLQAELDRMALHTRQPAVLRELFAALDNDPFVIAECLARPVLAQRLFNSVLASRNVSWTVSHAGHSGKRGRARFRGYTLPAITTALNGDGACNDAWAATSTVNAPSARQFHTAIWTGSEMIVWGGLAPAYSNSGGRYNPATDSWTPTSTTDAPAGRSRHTAVWTGSEMIVWGGFAGGSVLNTGGRYNPVTDSWTPTSTINAPPGRDFHVAVWTGGEMIVWGGWATNPVNTGGRYNPSTDSWTATTTTNAPSARYDLTAVWTGSEMIVWGGEDFSGAFNTGGRYNPGTDSWTATNTTNAPSARIAHTAIWTGSEMIVWGGFSGSGEVNTGGRYNPNADTWSATSLTNAPTGRESHTAVWAGNEMIVWSGYGGIVGDLNTGGKYNPGANSWSSTSTVNAPAARHEHKAVWTGGEMIVWGGLVNSVYVNTGGKYCGQYPSPTPTPTPTPTVTPTPTASPTPPRVHEAWVARYGSGFSEAKAIAVDSSGNVYVTGSTSAGYTTIKYSQSGQEEWVARYTGPGGEGQANAIAVDAAGNVYVTGGIAMCLNPAYGTIKYDSAGHQQWVATFGNGVATGIAVDGAGNVYVTGTSGAYFYATVKYNPLGEEQWVAIGPPDGLLANGWEAIAIDDVGNVYVTGTTNGHAPTGGDFDYGTVKYNSAGQQQWLATYNGPMDGWDQARAIAVDKSGNVYVTGRSAGLGTGRFDSATVKYNTSGQEQWVARYNGPANNWDGAEAIAVDGSGNVYVTGESVGVGSNFFDYATMKYDSSGQQQWVARYDGLGVTSDNQAKALALDSSNNVYVTGTSGGDYATIKYDGMGQEEWVVRYEGSKEGWDDANAIAVDSSGNVYVTGNSGTYNVDYATIKYVAGPPPSPTPTATASPTATATSTATPSATESPTPTPRCSTPPPTPTVTATPTATAITTASATPTATAMVTSTATATPTLTATLTPQPTATPSEPPCEVAYSQPACNSTLSTQVTDFTLYASYFINGFVGASDFTVNGTPANSASVGISTIIFHFNGSPVVQGQNTMHLSAGAFTCTNGRGVDEFMCTFTYQPSTLTPTPPPRSSPVPRHRPTPARHP